MVAVVLYSPKKKCCTGTALQSRAYDFVTSEWGREMNGLELTLMTLSVDAGLG